MTRQHIKGAPEKHATERSNKIQQKLPEDAARDGRFFKRQRVATMPDEHFHASNSYNHYLRGHRH
jgi:hypothetical protein